MVDITTTPQVTSSVSLYDKHEHETIHLFCSDCNEALCSVCLLERHQNHRLLDLGRAAKIIRSQLQNSVCAAKQCMSDALKKIEMLLHEKYSVLGKIEGCKTDVNQMRSHLKDLIDRHADLLLQNLESLKSERIESIDIEEKELDKHLDFLKKVETRCAELASTDRRDILFYKMSSELNEEMVEMKLVNKSILERQLCSFDIHFTKTLPSLSEVYSTKNIIGELKDTRIFCRQVLAIPEDGFGALTMNFTDKLIDITTTPQESSAVGLCDKHEDETIHLFCFDCNEALCLVCLLERHQNHRLLDLGKAADILRSQLQNSVCAAKQCMSDALKRIEMLLLEKYSDLGKIEGCKTEVNQIRSHLKALIDRHADSLLQKLESTKNERIENMEIEEKELDQHLDFLKSVETRCAELASADRHNSLFCKMASELHEEIVAMKLVNKSILERQLRSFDIHFTKTLPSLSEVYSTKNIIGHVKEEIGYTGKPTLVLTIETSNNAENEDSSMRGMVVFSNDIFIVYEKTPVVRIYDYNTRTCKTQLNLQDNFFQVDFTQCVSVDGSVYIVNRSREILRVDENLACTKWSSNISCGCLSVSQESTIVATCFEKHSLREYSLHGALLGEIELCPTIIHPLHAIKLRNGHFVVSHGMFNDSINRVCLVNDAGAITKTFGGARGSSIHQLHFPTGLAVDEVGNILVLDRNNSRVLLLSPELELKRVLLTKHDGLRRLEAMHLDEKTSRLFIADNNWANLKWCNSKILVFSVK